MNSALFRSLRARWPGSTPSLRHWLLFLAFGMVLLPLLHSLILYRSYVAEMQAAERAAIGRRLHSTALNVQARLDHLEAILHTLAESRAAREGDWPALYAYAQRVLQRDKRLAAISLIDADARLVFATVVPFGSEQPQAAAPEDVRRIFASARTVLSGPFVAPFSSIDSSKALVAVGVPVIRHGEATHVLRGVIFSESLHELLAGLNFPPGWQAVIRDREGLLVAALTSPGEAEIAGAVSAPSGALADSPLQRVDRNGTPYWTQVAHVPGWDWVIEVGEAEAMLDARVHHVQREILLAYVLILALLLGLGTLIIRRLSRSLRNIADIAEGAMRQLPVSQTSTGVRELDQLQADIGRMAAMQREWLDAARDQATQFGKLTCSLLEAQEIASLGSFELDVVTGKAIWSFEQYRIHGLDPARPSISLDDIANCLLPEEAAEMRAEFLAVVRQRQNYERQYPIVWPDGSRHWVYSRARPQFDEDGTLRRYVGTTQDITPRVQLETALRQSEERFRLAMEAAGECLWDWNTETGEVYYSPGYASLLGLEPGAIRAPLELGLALIYPGDAAEVLKEAQQRLANPGHYAIEFRMVRRDGSVCWVLSRAKVVDRDPAGKARRVIGTLMDISERKTLEGRLEGRRHQLEKERNFINTVLDTVSALVAVFEPDGRLVRHNRAWTELAGSRIEPWLGNRDWEAILTEDGRVALRQVFAELRGGADRIEHELAVHDGSGQLRQLLVRHSCLREPGGALQFMIMTAIDVSEQRRSEELAREHLDSLARLHRLQTADEMASVLAHELNQPLATIATYTVVCRQQLAKMPVDRDKLLNIIERINQATLRGGEIIHHMRRMVAQGEVATEVLDLNAIIRSAVKLMNHTARRKHIALRLDLAADLPQVAGVAVQIEQVLLNLLRNAFDAILAQGSGESWVMVSTRQQGNQARVTVADNGPGIAEAQAEQLFFSPISHKPNGLGLGLRISRSLIEAQGGRLWVEPHVPGAIFHFELGCVT